MLEVTFFGEYAFKVTNPIVLVNSVIGANPKDTVTYEEVVGNQLEGKFVEQLSQAISVVMRKNKVSFGDIQLYNSDISNEMNVCLDESWRQNYGLEVTDVSLRDINLTDESMAKVNKVDEATIFSNASLQSGLMASASADAMRNAASNPNGSMMGFMGMNMAAQTGANMMGAVNTNGQVQSMYNPQTQIPEPGTIFGGAVQTPVQPEVQPVVEAAPQVDVAPVQDTVAEVECPNCHTMCAGRFCGNCGTKVRE